MFSLYIKYTYFGILSSGTVRLYFKGSATAATLATTSNAATIAAGLNALFTLSAYREREGGIRERGREGGREGGCSV